MDDFTKKTITTSRGMTYTYWVYPSKDNKPALLLQHGFPDDHELWAKTVEYLKPLGYPIIVPDLLGYGETSKPADPEDYNIKKMSNDMIEIVDNEKQRYIIPVGHDWGSSLAQRVTLFHPDRVVGMILLNIAYRPPAEMDAEKANQMLIETTGLPRIAYQQFFVSPQGREIIEANLESSFHVLHGTDEGTKNFMEDVLCHHGALEEYLRSGKKQPLKEYAKEPGFKETWISRMQRDGFTGPLNWYKVVHQNINWNEEKHIPQEHLKLNIPVLFVGSNRDAVGLTQYIYMPQKAGLLPDLKVEEVDAGHWQTFENPKAGGEIIAAWLKERGSDLTAKL